MLQNLFGGGVPAQTQGGLSEKSRIPSVVDAPSGDRKTLSFETVFSGKSATNKQSDQAYATGRTASNSTRSANSEDQSETQSDLNPNSSSDGDTSGELTIKADETQYEHIGASVDARGETAIPFPSASDNLSSERTGPYDARDHGTAQVTVSDAVAPRISEKSSLAGQHAHPSPESREIANFSGRDPIANPPARLFEADAGDETRKPGEILADAKTQAPIRGQRTPAAQDVPENARGLAQESRASVDLTDLQVPLPSSPSVFSGDLTPDGKTSSVRPNQGSNALAPAGEALQTAKSLLEHSDPGLHSAASLAAEAGTRLPSDNAEGSGPNSFGSRSLDVASRGGQINPVTPPSVLPTGEGDAITPKEAMLIKNVPGAARGLDMDRAAPTAGSLSSAGSEQTKGAVPPLSSNLSQGSIVSGAAGSSNIPATAEGMTNPSEPPQHPLNTASPIAASSQTKVHAPPARPSSMRQDEVGKDASPSRVREIPAEIAVPSKRPSDPPVIAQTSTAFTAQAGATVLPTSNFQWTDTFIKDGGRHFDLDTMPSSSSTFAAGLSETSAPLRQTILGSPTAPDLPRNVIQQLTHGIKAGQDRTADILLNPAELGRVRISLQSGDTGVTVNILADRPETLELLRRNVDLLAQDFQDIGYGAADFAFGQGGQPQSHSAHDQEQGAKPHDRSTGADEPGSPDAGRQPGLSQSLDRIDIRL